MRDGARIVVVLAMFIVGSSSVQAAKITIDTNGFPNVLGGQVSGPGLAEPIKFAPGATRFVLDGLQAQGEYAIDFFHNSGESSSDFSITIDAAGKGVAAVGRGGGVHTMVVDFKPGDATLKLNAREIRYNANLGQTGSYWIHGLCDLAVRPFGTGPLTVKAIPGIYKVDNLYNSGAGNEDWSFQVDSQGNVSAGDRAVEEYAEFSGNAVNPRSVVLHFVVDAGEPVNLHSDQGATVPVRHENRVEVDIQATPGNTGINVWTFASSFVLNSDVLLPDGKSQVGERGKNDFYFRPRLRYDVAKKEWHFDTPSGRLQVARAEASGMTDGEARPLAVRCSASIVVGKTTTRPAAGAATRPNP